MRLRNAQAAEDEREDLKLCHHFRGTAKTEASGLAQGRQRVTPSERRT
jgi:hypothetical protein